MILLALLALSTLAYGQRLWIQFYQSTDSTSGVYSDTGARTLGILGGAAPAASFSMGSSHAGTFIGKVTTADVQYVEIVKTVDWFSPMLWSKSLKAAPFNRATIVKTWPNGTTIAGWELTNADVVHYDVAAAGDVTGSREHIVLSYTAISYSTPGRTFGKYTEGGYRVMYDVGSGALTAVA